MKMDVLYHPTFITHLSTHNQHTRALETVLRPAFKIYLEWT